MYPFRVFVSYSHDDVATAKKVVEILRQVGLAPLWDENIRPGMRFDNEIRDLISHSHIFLPLITKNSQKRPWVHQETGYAMGINIPVLPVAIENVPGEMIAQLQAITTQRDLSDLVAKLRGVNFEQMVRLPAHAPSNIVEVVDHQQVRSESLASYADRVMEVAGASRVRLSAVHSTFSIPTYSKDDPKWDQRYAPQKHDAYYYSRVGNERRALEPHARTNGCRLILDPTYPLKDLSPEARSARLTTLREFLDSMPDDKVEIVMTEGARERNLIIVGDWFVSESLTPRQGQGFRQTNFSWHAPTVWRRVCEFDREFDELYKASKLEKGASRTAAIETIDRVIAEIHSKN